MFKVYLANNKILSENDIKWIDIPFIPITKLEYVLPNKRILVMEGFQSYLCFKECYEFVYGAKGKQIDTINLFGKYGNKVYQFSMNLRKGFAGQVINSVSKEFSPLKWNTKENKFEFGKPQKTNVMLWKPGIVSTKLPICKIIK